MWIHFHTKRVWEQKYEVGILKEFFLDISFYLFMTGNLYILIYILCIYSVLSFSLSLKGFVRND